MQAAEFQGYSAEKQAFAEAGMGEEGREVGWGFHAGLSAEGGRGEEEEAGDITGRTMRT